MDAPPRTEDAVARLGQPSAQGGPGLELDPVVGAICVLTRRLAGAELALVSLVDAERQWFNSWASGRLGVPDTDTPRPVTFCSQMIKMRAPLIIPDALRDARFAADPQVSGPPHIRFYAGVPLISGQGRVIGSLCAISQQTRRLSLEEVGGLEKLAAVLVQLLEARNLPEPEPPDPPPPAPDRLITRAALLERLDEAFARKTLGKAGAESAPLPALVRCRLRDYERIAATFGRVLAEACLDEAARRILAVIPPTAVVAPFSEAELLVLVPDPGRGVAVEALGELILAEVSRLHRIGDLPFAMAMAIGLATATEKEASPTSLLADTSLALQMASRSAGSALRCVDARAKGTALASYRFETQFHSALHERILDPAFQPIVDLATGRPQGLEALVRWEHHGQLLPPARFMPQAEDAGVTGAVDLLVAEKTLAALPSLAAAVPGLPMTISLNLSSSTLKDSVLRLQLLNLLKRSKLPPGWTLQVELLEEAFQDTSEAFDQFLQHLTDCGVTIAIDDFGTGYSSLGRLIALPIQRVKLDRTFIARLDGGDAGPRKLLSRMVVMLADLGLEITAEGVDSPLQKAWLLDHGITSAQGYLFAPPLPREEVIAHLQRSVPPLLRPGGHPAGS